VADLSLKPEDQPFLRQAFDAVLIDPPRSGAEAVLPVVASSGARRIVYVSCNPATLARDAGLLVKTYGYRLMEAGVADMFPHTAHIESLALFEKPLG
jgi:23S rRNA (uracil1939-C5)-methyltransferase